MKTLKTRNMFLSLFIMSLLGATVLIQGGTQYFPLVSLKKAYNPGGFVETDPVEITNNAELTNFVLEHGFKGSGTPDDPFIITSLFFTDMIQSSYSAFALIGTTAYVIIENCSFSLYAGYGITIKASNVVIRNNYFDLYDSAVYLEDAVNVEISNNHVFRSGRAFYILSSTKITITNNEVTTISTYYEAIYLRDTNHSVISSNQVKYKAVNFGYDESYDFGSLGIKLHTCTEINVTNNQIENFVSGLYYHLSNNLRIINNSLTNTNFLFELQSFPVNLNITFENNTVNNKPVLFIFSESGKTIDASKYSQIVIYNGSNILLYNADLDTYGYYPVFIHYSKNITLKDSVIGHNMDPKKPIYISDSNGVNIENCSISGSVAGVYVAGAKNFKFINNEVEAQGPALTLIGIDTFFNVSNNVIRNSTNGIMLQQCENGYIEKNRFYDIEYEELRLDNTYLSSLKDNYFTGYGIRVVINVGPTTNIISDYDNNTINGKEILYLQNINSVSIADKDVASIILVRVSSVTLTRCTVSNGFTAISVIFSDHVTISDVNAQNNYYSIMIGSSTLVTVDNAYIINSEYAGFFAYSSQNVTIKNSLVNNAKYGVIQQSNSYLFFEKNSFYNINDSAMNLKLNNYVNVTGNTFKNIYKADLELYKNSEYVINHNVMEKGIYFTYMSSESSSSLKFLEFNNNTIDNNAVVLVANNYTAQTISNAAQVILLNASNTIITNNHFKGVYYSVIIWSSSSIEIKDNSFTNITAGIYSYGCTEITVQRNEFRNVIKYSIYLQNHQNASITENTVWDSEEDGILLYKTSFVNIQDNLVHSSLKVCSVKKSNNVTMEGNAFFDGLDGVYIYDTNNLTLLNNNFYNTSIQHSSTSYVSSYYSTLKIENNKVNNYPIIYLYNVSNQVIENQVLGQLIIAYSQNITVRGVTFPGSVSHKLHLISSNNMTIENTEFVNSTKYAVYVNNLLDSTFYNNTFLNSDTALYLYSANKLSVKNNRFDQYKDYAIIIRFACKIFVYNNYFKNSTTSYITSALDNGKNNEFMFNRWEGWTSPDNDNDGYVDSPYMIDGSDENYDLYPLAEVGQGTETTTTTGTTSTTEEEPGTSFLPPASEEPWLYALIAALIGLILLVSIIVYVKKKKKRARTRSTTRSPTRRS